MHACIHLGYRFNYSCYILCICMTEISDLHFCENISWTTICPRSKIYFNWSASSHCYHDRVISYNILASNCGSCPTTTNHTNVTCTDVPTDDSWCNFSVQSEACSCECRQNIMIPTCPGIHHNNDNYNND